MAKKTKRGIVYACAAVTFVALALILTYSNTAQAQLICTQELYLDPAAGTDSETCGIAEEPCLTLQWVTEKALLCSAELDAPVNVVQYTGPDYREFITVGQANASGLLDAPAAVEIGAPVAIPEEPAAETADDAVEVDAEAEAAEPVAVTVGEETGVQPAEEVVVLEEAVDEEVDSFGFGWVVSRTRTLYSILALTLGVILGVVIGYGSRGGQSGGTVTATLLLLCAVGAALTPATVWAQQCPGEYAFFSPEAGADTEMCGGPLEPCATLDQALNQAEACLHGVTIYRDQIPIFTLELSASMADIGDETVSEIGGSASNIDVADEPVEEDAVEEAAADVVEAVEEVADTAEEIIAPEVDEPVGDVDDWITWIGWLAVGAVLGYVAHALPAAKLD